MPKTSNYILGVRVDFGLSMDEVLDILEKKLLKDGKTHLISTTNPEFVMKAQHDSEFREIINSSDLSLPDGNGLLYANYYLSQTAGYGKDPLASLRSFIYGGYFGLASLFKKFPLGKVITGVDLTDKLCQLSSEKNYSVFFLGGQARDKHGKPVNLGSSSDNDFATLAAAKIKEKYPYVNIIGSTSQFSANERDDAATLNYIRQCMSKNGIQSLDLLFVAYGFPKQEKWITRNKDKLPAKVCVGVGSTFDYMTGLYRLAPDIIRRKKLEWLYKLIYQPWRLGRVLQAFPLFPVKVFFDSQKNK